MGRFSNNTTMTYAMAYDMDDKN